MQDEASEIYRCFRRDFKLEIQVAYASLVYSSDVYPRGGMKLLENFWRKGRAGAADAIILYPNKKSFAWVPQGDLKGKQHLRSPGKILVIRFSQCFKQK